jgi:hypothetical protein
MDSVVQYVMSEVFAAINHRLSGEYIKIELPTPDAKERYVTPMPDFPDNETHNFPTKAARRRTLST